MRKLLIGLSLLFTNQLIAQSLRYSIALPYTSLSGYSNKQNDAFSFTSNQAALANTLKQIRDKGRDGFYKGEMALEIENYMKKNGKV